MTTKLIRRIEHICVLLGLLSAIAGKAEDLSLWYSQPATNWLEALPIGNGRMVAMIFGGTTNERIQFIHLRTSNQLVHADPNQDALMAGAVM